MWEKLHFCIETYATPMQDEGSAALTSIMPRRQSPKSSAVLERKTWVSFIPLLSYGSPDVFGYIMHIQNKLGLNTRQTIISPNVSESEMPASSKYQIQCSRTKCEANKIELKQNHIIFKYK